MVCFLLMEGVVGRPGRGELPYEMGGVVRRKFWMKPLKETNLGVAQPLFDP